MEQNELMHYGVLGMKWGVRRYQNADGSLTTVGKKEYKKSLKSAKEMRRYLEYKVYDSSGFADEYYRMLKIYSKNYKKALVKDPTKSNQKTQRISNTIDDLDNQFKLWKDRNSKDVKNLKNHVNSMIYKYHDTKIKDVDIGTRKNGIEFVNSIVKFVDHYQDLRKENMPGYNADVYHPIRVYHS